MRQIAAVLIMAGLIIQCQSNAQVIFTIQPGSKLWLDGNSTLHKYSSKASEFTGSIRLDSALYFGDTRNLARVFQEALLVIPVKKLLSGDEKLDNNLYEAIKADDHPDITFRLVTDSLISLSKDTLNLNTAGKLTVAGKEKEIDIKLMVIRSTDSTLMVEGSKDLLMSDFGIDPPSMMLGLLKTDDKVVIHFQLHIRPQR